MEEKGFQVVFLQEASDFLDGIAEQARKKIYYNIIKVASGIKDSELFKKLEGSNDIWEFRTQYNGIQYRLLAFWDEKAKCLVVATHGFIKKGWKVPQKEIARAEALREQYYKK
jgi:phage-related protein